MRALPPPAPQTETTISFEVATRVGAVIQTFDTAEAAILFAETSQDTHPGCRAQRFKRTDRRDPLWPAYPQLQLVRSR